MSTLKIFVTLVILSSAACKNEPGNAQKTSSSDLAEMTIKIGDRVTSKCMIELDKSSVNHKGVRSFSSCIERDYSVSVAFCYVGHYAIMETSGDETKGELIALKLTQTDPRTNHVIFTQTSYHNITGAEQNVISVNDISISVKKAISKENTDR